MGGRVGHTQLKLKPQWLEARGVKQSRIAATKKRYRRATASLGLSSGL